VASGDPSALDLAQRECLPSLADQMTEIFQTISENERRWRSRRPSTPTQLWSLVRGELCEGPPLSQFFQPSANLFTAAESSQVIMAPLPYNQQDQRVRAW